MFLRAIEMAKRSRYDETSAFCRDHIRLNLLSAEDYDPGLPRVAKIRKDGLQATDDITFFDDVRGRYRNTYETRDPADCGGGPVKGCAGRSSETTERWPKKWRLGRACCLY
jgi:hypothetical protein